jgi:predicted transcriptional regulator
MLEIANNFTDDCSNRIASSKLKMVFKGFLPYAKLVEYLSLLLKNEFLAYREYEGKYKITEKGLYFLRLYYE